AVYKLYSRRPCGTAGNPVNAAVYSSLDANHGVEHVLDVRLVFLAWRCGPDLRVRPAALLPRYACASQGDRTSSGTSRVRGASCTSTAATAWKAARSRNAPSGLR